MKKLIPVLFITIMVNVKMLIAVTWQMESNPFSFQGVSVKRGHMNAERPVLRYSHKSGITTIEYDLPSNGQRAKLRIYNLSGTLIRSFELIPGVNSVSWNQTIAGTYLATVRYGTEEKLIRLLIVK